MLLSILIRIDIVKFVLLTAYVMESLIFVKTTLGRAKMVVFAKMMEHSMKMFLESVNIVIFLEMYHVMVLM